MTAGPIFGFRRNSDCKLKRKAPTKVEKKKIFQQGIKSSWNCSYDQMKMVFRMFNIFNVLTALGVLVLGTSGLSVSAWSHGDVVPQAMNTEGLPALGDEWTDTNPFRDDAKLKDIAIEIGSSGYNQNCARCHGLEVMSGGIAPDLRYLDEDFESDEWYQERVRGGAVREGKVYRPKFEGIISQEGLWAIRTYIDSRPDDD